MASVVVRQIRESDLRVFGVGDSEALVSPQTTIHHLIPCVSALPKQPKPLIRNMVTAMCAETLRNLLYSTSLIVKSRNHTLNSSSENLKARV
jgi:hypothetical protein